MNASPPFDPPFKTFEQTAAGMRITETLADGSTRDVPAEENLLPRHVERTILTKARNGKASQPSHNYSSRSAALPPAPGNARAAMFLNVPFAEKDEAKRLGAKWDSALRKWYVPHDVDIHLFSRWWSNTLK